MCVVYTMNAHAQINKYERKYANISFCIQSKKLMYIYTACIYQYKYKYADKYEFPKYMIYSIIRSMKLSHAS